MTPSEVPPANPVAIVAKGALALIGGLIAAVIAGWIICFLMDVLWERGKPAYAYIVWLLVPAILGFVALSMAGEWAAKGPSGRSWIYRPDAKRIALLLALGGLIAIGLAYLGCARLGWSYRDDDFWVPSSKPHTIAFLIGAGIGAVCSWVMAKAEEPPKV